MDRVVVLTTRPNEALAQLLVATLEAEGVRAEASGGLTAGFRAEAPGVVRVLVREEDLEHAREILAILESDPEDTEPAS